MEDKIIEIPDRINGYDIPVKAHCNTDGSYSVGVLNNPRGIPDSAKNYIETIIEKPVVGNVLTPLLTIKNVDGEMIRLGTLSIATDGSKPVVFHIYKNATLTGASYVDVGGDSYSQFDKSATAISGGEEVGGAVMNKLDTLRINLFTNDVFITATAGETLTIAALSSSNTEVTMFHRHLEKN